MANIVSGWFPSGGKMQQRLITSGGVGNGGGGGGGRALEGRSGLHEWQLFQWLIVQKEQETTQSHY